MTSTNPTGSTGSNRVPTGSRTQLEATGSTGSTGLLEDPVTGDPVTSVSDPSPGPRLTHPRQEPRP